jgi:hypothetical protein
VPQVTPAGLLVTVPLPVPALVTVRVKLCEVSKLKVAVTVVLAVTVMTHVPVPEQPPPLHPAKTEPLAALGVRVTEVPLLKEAEHVLAQLIPAGLLVTVPAPVPARVTVRVKEPVVAATSNTSTRPTPVLPPNPLTIAV